MKTAILAHLTLEGSPIVEKWSDGVDSTDQIVAVVSIFFCCCFLEIYFTCQKSINIFMLYIIQNRFCLGDLAG